MKMTHELRILLVILISTSFIFSFSHFGVLAFEGLVTKSNEYSENTMMGSINVSGLDQSAVSKLLTTKVAEWQNTAAIHLTYQEASTTLPVEELVFSIEETVAQLQSGASNNILVDLDSFALESALVSLSSEFSAEKVDIEAVKNEVLAKASMLEPTPIEIKVENYLETPVMKDEIIHSITIPIENSELTNIGATLYFEPNSTFSLLAFLEKQGLIDLDQDAMNILASGIYQTILPTNFQITERHIGTEIPTVNIKPGYEAKVNPKIKMDLAFNNPNNEAYRIEIYGDENQVIFDFIGPPFLYQYSIEELGFQEFIPKTIKQYSPLLNPGQTKISKQGQNGLYIEIARVIKDNADTIIEEELISKDYYPPVHQIKVFGLVGSSVPGETSNADETLEVDSEDVTETNDPAIEKENTNTEQDDELWGRTNETEK